MARLPAARSRSYEPLRDRALDDGARLAYELEQLRDTLETTGKQNKRKKPSTFELLNDPALLDYSLT